MARDVLHRQGHDLDLSDPKSRLAHGRVAQIVLVALLVTVANDQWRHTQQPPDEAITSAAVPETPEKHVDHTPLTGRSRPPPVP
ncbi:hypothetical protein AB0F17_37910 [Nonomuraea sp. NPDC026600]|uniref:hypothetical protein n=1 Tax=Nonomuraea sp. NPDC026600 TaxID=3155363 RepID=UPI0033F90FD9